MTNEELLETLQFRYPCLHWNKCDSKDWIYTETEIEAYCEIDNRYLVFVTRIPDYWIVDVYNGVMRSNINEMNGFMEKELDEALALFDNWTKNLLSSFSLFSKPSTARS